MWLTRMRIMQEYGLPVALSSASNWCNQIEDWGRHAALRRKDTWKARRISETQFVDWPESGGHRKLKCMPH